MKRRAFALRGTALLTTLLTGGCLGESSDAPEDETPTETQTATATATTVGRRGAVQLYNFREVTVSGTVRVNNGESAVFGEQFSLDQDGYVDYGVVFDEHGEYEVSVDIDDGSSKTKTVRYNEREWHNLKIYIQDSEIQVVGVTP